MRAYSLLVLAVALLPGCDHLLDQTDFKPKPPVVAVRVPPNPEPRPALITINYDKPNPEFRDTLAGVIRTVEARRPGILYDVVGVAGGQADSAEARLRAADVMTAIEANGVLPTRIQLGLTLESGRKTQQVRIYLR